MKKFLVGLLTALLASAACFGAGEFAESFGSRSRMTPGGADCSHIYSAPLVTVSENEFTDRTVTSNFTCLLCGHTRSTAELILHECDYLPETRSESGELSETASFTETYTVYVCRLCGKTLTANEYDGHECDFVTETVTTRDKYLNETSESVSVCSVCGRTRTVREYKPYPVPEFDPDAWYLLLVNRHHRITRNPDVSLTYVQGEECVDSRIAGALRQMLADCRAAGLSPVICSSYRPWSGQEYLYNNKVNSYVAQGYDRDFAEKKAALETAIPGTSEHQTGLAVDIISSSYRLLNEKQANTAEQKWLMQNCWKYGFVLRYPVGKTAETGIIYEPWHYRYVGPEVAKYLMETGLCLEELLDPEYIFTDTNY